MAATAGIVIYHPEAGQLARQVAALAGTVAHLCVFANSDLSAAEEAEAARAAAPSRLSVLRPGRNVGLGAAYNALLDEAERDGSRFLLLLDQDSLPGPGMAEALADLHDRLAAAGARPAVVGPHPVDGRGHPLRVPVLGPASGGIEADRVLFAISSGSLVDVAAARAVGPFRADFFIDAIDLEWCMRAGARGFSTWIARDVRMDHSLGQGVIRLPGLHLAAQPPRRLYTFIRNGIAMLRLPHVPVRHKLRFAASLPLRLPIYLLCGGFSAEVAAAIARGVADGLAGRLGPPRS